MTSPTSDGRRVLVVNAGSSSLKLSIIVGDETELTRHVEGWDGKDTTAIGEVVQDVGRVDVVGHRIVHGGPDHEGPVLLTPEIERELERLEDLAPLHQPAGLAGIRAAHRACPDVPAVACFDTAFHATLPPAARTYAVPRAWRDELGVRRYGFHGLSHAHATRRTAELLARPATELRIVVAHIGAGASLCAVASGRSVDTTMGFTPLEGLVMATRSGSIDPGLVLWLAQQAGLAVADIADALEHRSGLSALAELADGSGDMRQVITARDRGDATATLAFDVYLHHLRAGIASMVASLGGIDVLVFTGGVGEHAPAVRSVAAGGLGFLGLAIDPERNEADRDDDEDVDITAPGSAVSTLVVHAREDLQIAREIATLPVPQS